jgi:CMP/dCMP kinase
LNLARDDQACRDLNLRSLLAQLARTDLQFVVIGSSALAIQGWAINPGDLDLLTRPDYVERLAAAVEADLAHGKWVSEGAARRFECLAPGGPVDIYVEVSGGLTFDDVHSQATVVSIGEGNLSVRAGTPEHVRDMRAAVGREALPTDAVAPAARSNVPKLIAIDGPAGAGKSTVTRTLAKKIGFTYLDTGAMYRCVTLAVFEQRADTDDPREIRRIADSIEIAFHGERVLLNGKDVTAAIRTPEITEATPYVAAYPEVREAMVRQQRQLFSEGSYVAEGRDTTTVVAPDAPLKIYLTASLDERARRRAGESGESLAVLLDAIEERDRLDSDRELSALRIAEDAVVLDTSGHSIHEVVDQIVVLARERGLV